MIFSSLLHETGQNFHGDVEVENRRHQAFHLCGAVLRRPGQSVNQKVTQQPKNMIWYDRTDRISMDIMWYDVILRVVVNHDTINLVMTDMRLSELRIHAMSHNVIDWCW